MIIVDSKLILGQDEEMLLEEILDMTPEEFFKFVDEGEYCDSGIIAIYKHMKKLEGALESACEWRNECCPIDETGYTGAYPSWCRVVVSDADDDDNLYCRIKDESSMECWKKFFMGELIEEQP
jgi:hypothetical protein